MLPVLVVIAAAWFGYLAGQSIRPRIEKKSGPVLKGILHPMTLAMAGATLGIVVFNSFFGMGSVSRTIAADMREAYEASDAAVGTAEDDTDRGPRPIVEIATAAELKEYVRQAGDEPVLVDFYTTWCGPCRYMEPHIEAIAKEGHRVAKVDVDRAGALAQDFGVRSVPVGRSRCWER